MLAPVGSALAEGRIGFDHARVLADAANPRVAEQVAALVQQQGCDTVVMGTRGLGSFTGMLLGSVATRVIHEVSVPVLLVK